MQISLAIIWVVTGVLVYEAVLRIIRPESVNGKLMFILAVVGIAVNLINLAVLGGRGHHHEGHGQQARPELDVDDDTVPCGSSQPETDRQGHAAMSLGMKGAFIHVLGDCLTSLGVAIAAVIIWIRPSYTIADPICTFIFATATLFTTRSMVRDIYDIVMERVPRDFDLCGLESALRHIAGVDSIHDLHVWSIKPGMLMSSVHIHATSGDNLPALVRSATVCFEQKGIQHSTVQVNLMLAEQRSP